MRLIRWPATKQDSQWRNALVSCYHFSPIPKNVDIEDTGRAPFTSHRHLSVITKIEAWL
jgi:hypothetical protein